MVLNPEKPSAEPSFSSPQATQRRASGRKKRKIIMQPNRSASKQSAFKLITPDEAVDHACLDKYVPLYNNYQEISSTVYHWEIDSWSELAQGSRSPRFSVAGRMFQILAYPSGTNLPGHVGLYILYSAIDVVATDNCACAYFALLISNPDEPVVGIKSAFQHRFSFNHEAFGADNFGESALMTVVQPGFSKEIVCRNNVRISAYMRIIKDRTGTLWDTHWITRTAPKIPGCSGLVRVSPFPYLNALLQMFYHLKVLRQAILRVPIQDERYWPVLESIQNLFSTFDVQDAPANPMEIADALIKCNITPLPATGIQEFCSVLRNEMVRGLRNTVSAGAIVTLFQGRIRTTITDVTKGVSMPHSEDVYDLMLDIRDSHCLNDALTKFCRPVALLHQEGFGGENAQVPAIVQQSCFDKLPLVLHIHLSRFERDHAGASVTVRPYPFEFPFSIDMNEFMAESKRTSVPSTYLLTGVHFYHQDNDGELTYSCFLYRGKTDGWVQCIDGVVAQVDECEVLDLGTGTGPVIILRNSVKRVTDPAEQVYMLVYAREEAREQIVAGHNIMDLAIDGY